MLVSKERDTFEHGARHLVYAIACTRHRDRRRCAAVHAPLNGPITTLKVFAASEALAGDDLRGSHAQMERVLPAQSGWLNSTPTTTPARNRLSTHDGFVFVMFAIGAALLVAHFVGQRIERPVSALAAASSSARGNAVPAGDSMNDIREIAAVANHSGAPATLRAREARNKSLIFSKLPHSSEVGE